ncbi:MAG: hypothetical protein ACP5Q4_10880, partial [Candidatus Caldatribacteriaceae bacterium]
MRKIGLWIAIVVAFWGILVSPVFSQEANILEFSLCRGLDKDGFPLERIDKFSTEDEKVVLWVFLQEVKKGDEAKWEFIGPENERYESTLIFEEEKQYVGAQGELNLAQNKEKLKPGNWQARFSFKEKKLIEVPFTLVESTITESKSLEEAVKKTVSLLNQFGYQVLEVNISGDDQAYIRMTMAGTSVDQSFWNQIGSGFEALKRIFPEIPWLLVQLIMQEEYLLSFQVKASDFDYWRRGY